MERIKTDKVVFESAKTEEEMVDRVSDIVKDSAHTLAMLKKGVSLQTGITEELFDKAFEKEMNKEWDKVKDLDMHKYIMVGVGEMLMNGVEPERIFGDKDGEEDS